MRTERGRRRKGPPRRTPKNIFITSLKKENPKPMPVMKVRLYEEMISEQMIEKWTIEKIKNKLRENGLPLSGKRDELVNRLKFYLFGKWEHVDYKGVYFEKSHDFKIDESFMLIENEGDLANKQASLTMEAFLIPSGGFTIQDFFVKDTKFSNIEKEVGGVQRSYYSPKRAQKIGVNIDCWSDGNNNRKLLFDIIGWYPKGKIFIKNKNRKYDLISNQSTKYIEIDGLSGKEKFELWTENITWPLAKIEKKMEKSTTIFTKLKSKELKFYVEQEKGYEHYYQYNYTAKIQYFIETKDWENKTHYYRWRQEIRGEASLDFIRVINTIRRKNNKVFAWRFIKIKVVNKEKIIDLDLGGEDLEEWKKWRIHSWSSHNLVLSLEGKESFEFRGDIPDLSELQMIVNCDLNSRNKITINPLGKLLLEADEQGKNLVARGESGKILILPGKRVVEIAIEERDIDIKEDVVTWRVSEEIKKVLRRVISRNILLPKEIVPPKEQNGGVFLEPLGKMSFKYKSSPLPGEWFGLLNVNLEEIAREGRGIDENGLYRYSVKRSVESNEGTYSTRLDFTFDMKELCEKYVDSKTKERILFIEINKEVYLIIKDFHTDDFKIKSSEKAEGVRMEYGPLPLEGSTISVVYHHISDFWFSQYKSSRYIAIKRTTSKTNYWESRNFNRMYENRKIIKNIQVLENEVLELTPLNSVLGEKKVEPQVLIDRAEALTKEKIVKDIREQLDSLDDPSPQEGTIEDGSKKVISKKKTTKPTKVKTIARHGFIKKTSSNKKENAWDIINRVKNNRPKTDSNVKTGNKKLKGQRKGGRKDKDQEHKKLKKSLNYSRNLPQKAQKRAKRDLEDFYKRNPEYRGENNE